MADNAIALDNVSKRAGGVQVLDGVSMAVPAGAFYVLAGKSGAGKSSLLSVAGGLDADFTGRATVFGQSPLEPRVRNRDVGFVFQIPRLFANLSVWQNLTAPSWIGSVPYEATWAASLLDRVGLAHKRRAAITGLSGGERQRLTVARALLNKPRVLLCDEPTGNLDRATGDDVIALLRSLGITLFIVTHDPVIAAQADRVITIAGGRLQ